MRVGPQWQAAGKDAGSLVADPEFSPAHPFELTPSSPAIVKLGFVPIDISTVGPVVALNGDGEGGSWVGSQGAAVSPTGVSGDEHFLALARAGLVR